MTSQKPHPYGPPRYPPPNKPLPPLPRLHDKPLPPIPGQVVRTGHAKQPQRGQLIHGPRIQSMHASRRDTFVPPAGVRNKHGDWEHVPIFPPPHKIAAPRPLKPVYMSQPLMGPPRGGQLGGRSGRPLPPNHAELVARSRYEAEKFKEASRPPPSLKEIRGDYQRGPLEATPVSRAVDKSGRRYEEEEDGCCTVM